MTACNACNVTLFHSRRKIIKVLVSDLISPLNKKILSSAVAGSLSIRTGKAAAARNTVAEYFFSFVLSRTASAATPVSLLAAKHE